MIKVAIIVLADTETHEDIARVHNALLAAKEFKDVNDDFKLIFDGAGTKWIKELSKPDHMFHELFDSLKGKSTGVCSFCAGAFGIKESAMESSIPLMGEYEEHPSFRKLISQGYQIITF
ncbi:MAG: DsrE family protein [Candidatus Methanoperedens sp.]|nr:DsrE family protein [Candidatus Methanoperedens sp.]